MALRSLPSQPRSQCLQASSSRPRTVAAVSAAKAALQSACALACSATILLAPNVAVADDNPYREGLQPVQLGATADGTIRSCPGNVNPNCVSTANTNELYAPAWRSDVRTAKEAAEELERTVLASYEEWELARAETVPAGEYRAWLVPSAFGKDVVEFLIKEEPPSTRNPDAPREGAFVTYRSLAGSVKYIWPIQQPITDGGAQKTRLSALREKLGWRVIGCEYIECFE
ncbi:hypothetical protein HYH03_008009 [Edaphochlamys debaryana]|uniref:Uncharacterized protein n=1 Tax=Edaphochlamys debaryana TaxID=47281 RepID=A0A835YA59_9CHLO|nr:hypothetical protein HYH03_008009 [Edaphochlamys debaryana]|eukprot:KAG2493789.1 hypothetical protein HYH03_008009 [Edaphochlamys debaryana]